MKISLLAGGLVLSLAMPVFAAGEEDAIKARGAEFNAAWAKNDAKALAAFWTEDGTVVNPAGKNGKGRAEIEKVIAEDLSTFLKGAKFNFTVTSVRMLKPDVAFIDATHEVMGLKGPDGKDMPPLALHVVASAILKDKKWMWVDARPYAFVPPPPAPPAGQKKS